MIDVFRLVLLRRRYKKMAEIDMRTTSKGERDNNDRVSSKGCTFRDPKSHTDNEMG
jgi:hypothetical protein